MEVRSIETIVHALNNAGEKHRIRDGKDTVRRAHRQQRAKRC
jgi:hypothetical protein